MVTINFTLFVQLGLFLLFIWVMNRLVLRPALRVMDKRAEAIEDDHASAESDIAKAKSLESRYTSEIAAARRAANVQVERARREVLDARHVALNKRRQQGDEAVAEVEAAANARVDAQRAQFDGLAHQVAERIKEHLGLGGPQS